jgi:8-oxo-dGTP pyrophosphatase MutT (NUDIX family)
VTEAELRARLALWPAYRELAFGQHVSAAVLVGLEPGRGVWLTRRDARLPTHAGQVSFPGGKVEADDASVTAAALREAAEEIELDPRDAEVLGRLDDFVTGTGFHISPVVALVRPGARFVAAPSEVAEVFCLPFDVLMDVAAPQRRRASWAGGERGFWVWFYGDHVIWGATAKILVDLARRLRGE